VFYVDDELKKKNGDRNISYCDPNVNVGVGMFHNIMRENLVRKHAYR